ncbi:Microtubule binding protein YTM1 [Sesbania bispinosa]|nr:Microtubule binding protein YTM1 [Sesbania bispinosa]
MARCGGDDDARLGRRGREMRGVDSELCGWDGEVRGWDRDLNSEAAAGPLARQRR